MKLLKFHAPWCGPCKAFAPTIEKVSAEMNLEVEDVNVDGGVTEERVTEFRVMGVPTVVLLDDDGDELSRITGQKSEKEFKEWLQEAKDSDTISL